MSLRICIFFLSGFWTSFLFIVLLIICHRRFWRLGFNWMVLSMALRMNSTMERIVVRVSIWNHALFSCRANRVHNIVLSAPFGQGIMMKMAMMVLLALIKRRIRIWYDVVLRTGIVVAISHADVFYKLRIAIGKAGTQRPN